MSLQEEILYDLAYAIARCIQRRLREGKPGLPFVGDTARPKGRRRK